MEKQLPAVHQGRGWVGGYLAETIRLNSLGDSGVC